MFSNKHKRIQKRIYFHFKLNSKQEYIERLWNKSNNHMQTMFCLNGKKSRLLFTGIVCRIKYCIMSKKKFFFQLKNKSFSWKSKKKSFPLVLLRFANNEHSELFCINSNALSHMFEWFSHVMYCIHSKAKRGITIVKCIVNCY